MLNWQCCLAGSSKTAPRILIFSIAIGADYSFHVKTIETHARAFMTLNILAIGRVYKEPIYFDSLDQCVLAGWLACCAVPEPSSLSEMSTMLL